MYIPYKWPMDLDRPWKRDWKATQFWGFSISTLNAGSIAMAVVNQGVPAAAEGFAVQAASAFENGKMRKLGQMLKLKAKRIRKQQIRRKGAAGDANPMFTGFTYDDLLAIAAVCRYPQTGVHPRS